MEIKKAKSVEVVECDCGAVVPVKEIKPPEPPKPKPPNKWLRLAGGAVLGLLITLYIANSMGLVGQTPTEDTREDDERATDKSSSRSERAGSGDNEDEERGLHGGK